MLPDTEYKFILFGASVIAVAVTVKILRKLTTEKCKCTARLDGKTVLITGGNAGIGKATALEIAKRGARLIIASRNVEKSKKVQEEIIAQTHNPNVIVRQLDLSSLASVRNFAREFLESESRLDVLINNAASPGTGGGLTEDGIEVGMQVNHLGHFLLTNLLLDLLKSSAPSRIVVVSSDAHNYGNKYLNPNDLNDLPKTGSKFRNGFFIYCLTKLCNMLMVKELSKRLQGTGVTVNGLHPGTVPTEMWDPLPKIVRWILTVVTWPVMQNEFECAQTTLHLTISDEVEGISGKFFSNCKITEKSKMAEDEEIARIVWETSSRMVQERSSD